MRKYQVSPELMAVLIEAVGQSAAWSVALTGRIGEPFMVVLTWLWPRDPQAVGVLARSFALAARETAVASGQPLWPTDADQVINLIGEEFRARALPFDPDLSLTVHAALTAG